MSLLPTHLTTLGPCSGTTAVYLKLTPDAVNSILASGGKNVKLRMGQKIELNVNGQVYSTSSIPEPQHIDLYKSNGSKYDCIGKVSARYSVQRPIDSVSSSRPKTSVATPTPPSSADSRKALLEAAGEIKRSSSARATPPHTAHAHLKVQEVSKSTPTSPLINGRSVSGTPSRLAPTAAAVLPQKPLAQQSLTSAPIRVIHLLALGPNSPRVLAQRTGAPMAEVESILKEYCVGKGDATYTLKDSTWKDIRVWEWKYSTFERNNVIKSAKAAFDRLKLSSDHQLRKNLIDPKTRPAVSSTITNNNNTTPPYTYANATEKSLTPNRRTSPSKSSSPRVLPQPAQPQTSSSSSSSSSLSGAAPLKRKAAASSTNGPASKRLSTGTTSTKKEMAMKIGNWKELCGLVSRFKKHYPEYVRLYSMCDTHHPDYPRMVKMHNQLLGWKQTIWDNVPDDAPEEVKKWMKEITA